MPDVLVIGAGGLGCPAAIALAHAGARVTLADDDLVERSNLHRQILFTERDIGEPKTRAAKRALEALIPGAQIEIAPRVLPENALALVARADVVVEGSDNFPTKFMVADACALARVPVVHGACIRWHGTALAIGARGAPCYRCLFEDVPAGPAESCAEAGVMGPVCGVIGALQADLALGLLAGEDVLGTVVTFDGKLDRARRWKIPPRPSCPLCGENPTIKALDRARYAHAACAA